MELLAKSPKNGQQKTLLEHSQEVMQTFACLFGSWEEPTRLGLCWRRFFRLTPQQWQAFYQCAVPTMLLHDLGKANNGFQDSVRHNGFQVFRHEHLSALLLAQGPLRRWLETASDRRADLVIAAIVGHHLKSGDQGLFKLLSESTIIAFEPEGLELVAQVDRLLGCKGPRTLAEANIEKTWVRGSGPTGQALDNRLKATKQLLSNLDRRICRKASESSDDYRKILMALRAALIVADSAASGLTRENKPLLSWLQTAFGEAGLIDGDYIEKNIIRPRIAQITGKHNSFQWQDFQNAAATFPSRTLLLASCGSGKTLAAWRWIQQQLSKRPVGRVIFLYPTRATATEGFRDYVSWAPEADVSLLTGTAPWELMQGLFDTPEDKRKDKSFATEARLFAIGYWHRRVFSATVDQFLGFMQNSYASICLLPMLADSVVVVDEVHSFDRSLFSVFRSFLANFDVPVLAMTASLPRQRQVELTELGLATFPEDISHFQNLAAIASMLRYQVERLPNREEAESIVQQALRQQEGAKILWVVNTIERCQEVARRFASSETLCYHSGFTLRDRKQRHQEVVSRFQHSDRPLLAVTTQVCEMSLDLDADILVTEEAPITSLIQRMGRCNRAARPGDNKLGKVFVYQPECRLPYDQQDWCGSDGFLDALHGRTVDQQTLQQLLDQFGPDQVEPKQYAAFLECGPYAVAREESLRDSNEMTVQAILSSDVSEFTRLRQTRQPTDGLLLPAPRRLVQSHATVGQFPQVVDADLYSPIYGLSRKPETTA
ncbi:CRISPR-associated helicase Cas3' [bacterium]|nr:CRISPR-associated helicase Cas3' [bacterium]